MASKVRFAASTVTAILVFLGTPGAARAQAPEPFAVVAGAGGLGSVRGEVRDATGGTLEGAVVSLVGDASAFSVTDEGGRFEFAELPPGVYAVRAHLGGFVTPSVWRVEVRASSRTVRTIVLRRADEGAYPILAAGLAGATQDLESLDVGEPALPAKVSDHDTDAHTGTAWRIRHARRSVLKQGGFQVDGFSEPEALEQADTYDWPGNLATLAAGFFADAPLSGQVNLYATGALNDPRQLFGSDTLARGVTYVSVGAPVGVRGDWTVRGALNQADISTWFVAGAYTTREESRHRYEAGLSYAAQRYDGGNLLTLREVSEGDRTIGSVYAADTFSLTPRVGVVYGGRYERYDYLERGGLFSPRVGVTLSLAAGLSLDGTFSRRALAPGAEEFLPPDDGALWLPPQRSFSAAEIGRPFEAERVTHAAVGIERELGSSSVSVRVFHQEVADQLVALFGARAAGRPDMNLGHYLVGNAGDVDATGWTVEFRTALAERLSGSVAYSVARASLTPSDGIEYLVLLAPSLVRAAGERIQDVSTRLEADLPETATRVLVLYRASTGFARPAGVGDVAGVEGPGFESRFDVQVRQSLPFMSFYGARLEMLVALRNFFRDIQADQSIYDELLVVSPPKQIVGGLTLHF